MFYLLFTSLIFYFHNLCFILHLLLINKLYVIFVCFYFVYYWYTNLTLIVICWFTCFYLPFTSFIFYFVLDLQVLYYICKSCFICLIIYPLTIPILIYLFYLLLTTLMFHLHNLYLMFIYKLYVTFTCVMFRLYN